MLRFLALAVLALSASAYADIDYKVTCFPEKSQIRVRIEIPKTEQGATLQIPNWAPGSYRLVDNYRNVLNLTAKDGEGRPLTFTNETNTWKFAPAEKTVVEYDLASAPNDGSMHWAGPSTYMYVVGRINEKCNLTVDGPLKWVAYCGLDGSANTFTAPDYDVLADNPVTTGDVLVDTYISRGKRHYIVLRGKPRHDVDRAYLLNACRHVSDAQTDFFGRSAPYNHYVWHFNVTDNVDGAGGLEHLSSTQITLASGLGPRAISVISHEFFHLWNVKRIRSAPLGPFDYTQLPQTGALWWLEGVTDYYGHYLLYRYGWWGKDMLYKDILDNLNSVRNNQARLTVSPFEASWRVKEAANGRGNSQGYQISYYPYGWIAGFILDIELRHRTQGKHSLDEVTLALWEQCKDGKPGFEEDQIRKELQRLGGFEMGYFYDSVVRKPGEVIVEQQLAKIGLGIVEVDEAYPNPGFTMTYSAQRGGYFVGNAGENGQVRNSDQVVKVGDIELTGTRRAQQQAVAEWTAKLKSGEPANVSVKRGNETILAQIIPTNATRRVKKIMELDNATQTQLDRRNEWMRVIKPR